MKHTKIYLIPGLGADRRMYEQQLKVLPDAAVLEHQKPGKNETLAHYTARLAKQIDTSEPFILIGSSLGGIIAIELSRILHPENVILISSIKNRSEMPLWMRSMKYLNLHKLITGAIFVWFSKAHMKRLVTRRDTKIANLLLDMHDSADTDFVIWAINQVVKWHGNADHIKDVIHLHGTNDRIFPHTNIKNAILIKGGSHVMGMTLAHEVNKVLLEILGS